MVWKGKFLPQHLCVAYLHDNCKICLSYGTWTINEQPNGCFASIGWSKAPTEKVRALIFFCAPGDFWTQYGPRPCLPGTDSCKIIYINRNNFKPQLFNFKISKMWTKLIYNSNFNSDVKSQFIPNRVGLLWQTLANQDSWQIFGKKI